MAARPVRATRGKPKKVEKKVNKSSNQSEDEVYEASTESSEPNYSNYSTETSDDIIETVHDDEIRANNSPTKRKIKSGTSGSKGGSGYVPLTKYSPLPWTCYNLEFWQRCVEGARPVKRSVKGKRKGVGPSLQRPPVDALQLGKLQTPTSPKIQLSSIASKWPSSWPINVTLKDELQRVTKKLRVDTTASDGVSTLIRVPEAEGGVIAMEWCGKFLLAAAHRYPNDVDHPFIEETIDSPSPVNVFYVEIAKGMPQVSPYAKLYCYGRVRSMFSSHHLSIVGVIYSTGHLALFSIDAFAGREREILTPFWHLPLPNESIQDSKAKVMGFKTSNPCCGAWAREGSQLFAIGFTDGWVRLYRFYKDRPGSSSIDCIAAILVSYRHRPVTSLSFHPHDELLLLVGVFDSRAVIINWRYSTGFGPLQLFTLYSPTCPVSLVNCPTIPPNTMLVADAEGACRLFFPRAEDPMIWSDPLGSTAAATLTAPVSCLDSSPLHNVLIFGTFEGNVHYSILDAERRSLLVERKIISISPPSLSASEDLSHNKDIVIQRAMEMPTVSRDHTTTLPHLGEAITSVRWCTSSQAPGLVAVALGCAPLIILHSMDRLLLLEPSS